MSRAYLLAVFLCIVAVPGLQAQLLMEINTEKETITFSGWDTGSPDIIPGIQGGQYLVTWAARLTDAYDSTMYRYDVTEGFSNDLTRADLDFFSTGVVQLQIHGPYTVSPFTITGSGVAISYAEMEEPYKSTFNTLSSQLTPNLPEIAMQDYENVMVSNVPEPSAWPLLLLGLSVICWRRFGRDLIGPVA